MVFADYLHLNVNRYLDDDDSKTVEEIGLIDNQDLLLELKVLFPIDFVCKFPMYCLAQSNSGRHLRGSSCTQMLLCQWRFTFVGRPLHLTIGDASRVCAALPSPPSVSTKQCRGIGRVRALALFTALTTCLPCP